MTIAKTVKQTEIDSWQAIDRLDVRRNKGIIKIRAKSHWEIQIDTTTGEILKTAFRRSDIIEQLHDQVIGKTEQTYGLPYPLPLPLRWCNFYHGYCLIFLTILSPL